MQNKEDWKKKLNRPWRLSNVSHVLNAFTTRGIKRQSRNRPCGYLLGAFNDISRLDVVTPQGLINGRDDLCRERVHIITFTLAALLR